MPQTLTPEWFEMLGIDASEVHAEWLHTVGNLTLTGYNPELSNRPYQEKRRLFALSHFELNRHFGDYERWGAAEVQLRAQSMFTIAIQLWPRPEPVIVEVSLGVSDKGTPASFHADCVKLAQQHLGVHLSKLSQTRYESGDGSIRLCCAVSTAHDESRELPYFWFGLHKAQVEFLNAAQSPYLCLGCSSAETTLLVPLTVVLNILSLVSVTKTDDRQYWHLVIQKRLGRFVLRLLGGKDGPDLSEFDIGNRSTLAEVLQS
jgi:hypothetical protein